jgi:hypothetical protein
MMMRLPLITCIIFIVFCCTAFAQQTLSNQDIVALVKAGIGEDVVVAKIKSSACNFDTSSNTLIELKKEGVSDNVIMAMLGQVKISSVPLTSSTDKTSKELKTIEEANQQISRFFDSNRFSVVYDRFKDSTRATVSIDVIPKPKPNPFASNVENNTQLKFILGSFYAGNGISSNAASNLLCADSSSANWKLLKNDDLSLLVNSERISLGKGMWDGDVKQIAREVMVSEFVCWTVEKTKFDAILNASKIEFQLGNVEATISDENLRLFKLYQELISAKDKSAITKPKVNFSLADASGKRKVFIETTDKQCENEIIKELKSKNFEIVSDSNLAELIIQFEVEQTDQVYVLGSAMERKWGKLTVYLRSNENEGQIFIKSRKPSTFGQLLHKQAGSLTEDFIKALIKTENSK